MNWSRGDSVGDIFQVCDEVNLVMRAAVKQLTFRGETSEQPSLPAFHDTFINHLTCERGKREQPRWKLDLSDEGRNEPELKDEPDWS